MLGLAGGAILVPLNTTMLAVSLPSVMGEFGLGPNTVSSLVTLYLGAVVVALPASGSLGDRFGHRRTFLGGVVGFAVASLLAASAGSFFVLEIGRVLQAVAGAFVSTSSAALVRQLAPPEQRGEAFGLFGMLVNTSAAVGPLIGGLLVAAFGWRSLFFVAVPVALLGAVVVGVVHAPPPADEVASPHTAGGASTVRPRSIDLPGLGLISMLLVALLITLRSLGDGRPAWAAAIIGLALLVAFVAVELRADHPAVDPRLFLIRPFAAAVGVTLLATVVLHATLIIVPLLVERLLAGSPATSGLVLLGISGLGALAAPFGGRLSDRAGRRGPVLLGMLLAAGGLAALWLGGAQSSTLIVAMLLSIVGLGLGLSGSPAQAAALESVRVDRVGMAASTFYTGRYLGGVLGASLAGAVLGTTVTSGGASLGFALLAAVGVGAAVVARGLPRRATGRA